MTVRTKKQAGQLGGRATVARHGMRPKTLLLTLSIFISVTGLIRLAMSDLNGWGVRWLIAGVLFLVHGAVSCNEGR